MILQKIITSHLFQRLVNKRVVSAFFGWLSQLHLPASFLKKVISGFVREFNTDLSEYDFNIEKVNSFNDFFSRKLLPGKRIFAGKIASPADGILSASGKLAKDTFFPVKGTNCSFADFTRESPAFTSGSFAVIYLGLGDYHRVHMPFDAIITGIRWIPGTKFSVTEKTLTHFKRVFCRNERMVIQGTSETGAFYIVLVGAIVVGKIKLAIPVDDLRKNQKKPVNIPMNQGDELGHFEMGSSVVLLVESEDLSSINMPDKQTLKTGDQLC